MLAAHGYLGPDQEQAGRFRGIVRAPSTGRNGRTGLALSPAIPDGAGRFRGIVHARCSDSPARRRGAAAPRDTWISPRVALVDTGPMSFGRSGQRRPGCPRSRRLSVRRPALPSRSNCRSASRLAAFGVVKSASLRPVRGGVEAGAKGRQCRSGASSCAPRACVELPVLPSKPDQLDERVELLHAVPELCEGAGGVRGACRALLGRGRPMAERDPDRECEPP